MKNLLKRTVLMVAAMALLAMPVLAEPAYAKSKVKKSDLAFELRNADLVNGNTITVRRGQMAEIKLLYKGTPVKFRLKMKNSRRLGMRRPDESWSKKVQYIKPTRQNKKKGYTLYAIYKGVRKKLRVIVNNKAPYPQNIVYEMAWYSKTDIVEVAKMSQQARWKEAEARAAATELKQIEVTASVTPADDSSQLSDISSEDTEDETEG